MKSNSVYPSDNNTFQSKLSACRYWCIRLVSCAVPGIKSSIPIIGGRTLVEVICVLILAAMAVALSLPSNKTAGHYGDFFGAATTILGLRNNLLSILFGISYERALFWHKVMGCATLGMICFHGLVGFNLSGFLMCFGMGIMLLTYLIKSMDIKNAFEIFYYAHLASIIVIIGCGQVHHSAMWFSFSGALWVIDVVLRSFITSKTIKASVTCLPGKVVKLTFESSMTYGPGQYAFVRIPEVNKVEFHPFSFSSCPQQDTMTMHVRELGDWTTRLGDLARAHAKSGKEGDLTLDVMLDGPYGNMQVNVHNPEYEVFLLISGGIGITPNQSLYNSLTAQAEAGRSLRKVLFLWSVKDRAIIDSMTPAMLSSNKLLAPLITPTSFQPAMVGEAPDSLNTPNPMFEEEGVELSGGVVSRDEARDIEASAADSAAHKVFENRFYLTQVRDEKKFSEANISPAQQPWLHFGRPDLAQIFDEVRAMLLSDQEQTPGMRIPRVCVSVCGPPAMVHSVKEQCRVFKLGCSEVAFDCHAEVFDL
jgi:NAD(P)H-flavin reductase